MSTTAAEKPAQTTAVATAAAAPPAREPTPYERFRNYVQTNDFIAQVAALVGGEAQAKTFVRVVLTAVQQTPDLLGADRRSLLLACMKAARDRLMPDGKEAVFNIYSTKVKVNGKDEWVPTVQYLPMVAGLVKKLYASEDVTFVDSAAVYAADKFHYERGDNPRIAHEPTAANEPGEIIAAYVVVKLRNGEIKREVMFRRDIEKVRQASKSPDGPGWAKWYDQFAIKSVIKRAYKQLPSSVELEQIIESDNDAIGFADFADAGNDQFKTPPAIADINAAVTGAKTPAPALEDKPVDKVPQTIEGASTREPVPGSPEDIAAARAKDAAKAKAKTDDAKASKAVDTAPTFAEIATKINAAKTQEELQVPMDLVRSLASGQHQREANLLIADRMKALAADARPAAIDAEAQGRQ